MIAITEHYINEKANQIINRIGAESESAIRIRTQVIDMRYRGLDPKEVFKTLQPFLMSNTL